MSNQVQGLPVAGYKPTQPQWAVDAVNRLKALEERVLRELEGIEQGCAAGPPDEPRSVDGRWIATARTDLQKGFMAAARGVFQPGRVHLPEDGH